MKKNFKKILISVIVLVSILAAAIFLKPLFLRAYMHFTRAQTTAPAIQTVRITFPEGFTVREIAQKLEENGVCSAQDFINAVNAPELSDELWNFENGGDRAYLLEGYIFPDTYDFYVDEDAQSVLNRFLENFKNKITSEHKQRAAELGYSMDEIITIASIVQEEASVYKEMGKVSSVLHNRLKSNAFPGLQCDATINYVNLYMKPYFDTQLSEKYASLYNTYKFKGLPAGPITNPGLAAIEAALNYEDTDYYYFVTDENGNYYYAKTFAEHNENCRAAGITTD